MKHTVNFLRQHPVIVVVYLLYTLLWLNLIRMTIIQGNLTGMSRLTVGEAMVYYYFFMLFLTAVYVLASLTQAFFVKKKSRLYLVLSLIIFVPPLVVTIVGELL